jgi:hypothetical protein
MKRDEREYEEEEETPSSTQKARLEEEAASLLSLPNDIRKMVMMKMKPIDMYVLYDAVNNYGFKKWCDTQFWDYALRQLAPDYVPPEYMRHPRWRFFSYTLANLFFDRKNPLRAAVFINPRIPDTDDITVHVRYQSVEFLFLKTRVDVGRFLFDTHVTNTNTMPHILTEEGQDSTIYVRPGTRVVIAVCYYHFFSLGYKYAVYRSRGREFLLGCHLCGREAKGYSAEDPSKLLCGMPGCSSK